MMKINNNGLINFAGQVKMNKEKIAKEIKNSPEEQQDSIIGNINTLKQRLETQTPYYKHYTIDYKCKYVRSPGEDEYGIPSQSGLRGLVKVTDEEGNEHEGKIELTKKEFGELVGKASGEEIWLDGFMNITYDILNQFKNKPTHEVDPETQSIMDKLI